MIVLLVGLLGCFDFSSAVDYKCDVDYIKKILNPETGVVFLSGGGSFGDIWPCIIFFLLFFSEI